MVQPTQEQQAAVDAFATGEDLVVTAGAGTGKTTLLRQMARSRADRGLYVAFNKAIATEAQASFPRSVQARTAHSLAYGWARRSSSTAAVLERLSDPRRPPVEVAEALGVESMVVPTAAGATTFSPTSVLRWVQQMVTAFMQSDAPAVDPSVHLPVIPGATAQTVADVAAELAPLAVRAWEDMSSAEGVLPVTHAVYLKLWSLAGPQLPGSYVLFDEAQDASPVIASVVTSQHCQRVMVGDPAQSIYGFTGAIDAMSTFPASHRLALTRSFRFGPQIAQAANVYLELLGGDLRLTGSTQIDSRIVPVSAADAVLCRGNAGTIAEALLGQGAGLRTHIVGGVAEQRRFVDAADELMTRGKCTHPELGIFTSWDAVCEYVDDPNASSELQTMVKLVTTYGVPVLRQVLTACTPTENTAQVLISTVHKAKGREWPAVHLADDLDPAGYLPALDETDPDARARAVDELRVGYVAVTRAREELGAGLVAEALAGHGFPTARPAPPTGPAEVGAGEEFVTLEVPVRADLWDRLCEGLGEDGAARLVPDLLQESITAAVGRLAQPPRTAPPTRSTGAQQPPTGTNVGNPACTGEADDLLGAARAQEIRSVLDTAVRQIRADLTACASSDREVVAVLDEHLLEAGLQVHRRPGIVGFSLTAEGDRGTVRFAASALGWDYSGPALLRRIRDTRSR